MTICSRIVRGFGFGSSMGFAAARERVNSLHMATNLNLEAKLVEEARRVGRHRTKKDAISAALAEYVGRRKQLRILPAFGTVEFDPKYNYKTERQARSQEREA
jgi:hypothetical protein